MVRKVLSFSIIMLMIISTTMTSSADEITREEKVIIFNNISKIDRSLTLELPKEAKVSYFSLGLTGPYEPGPEQPQNITLDLGDNGTIDWSFKFEYGPLGYQNVFANGDGSYNLSFNPDHYDSSAGIYLPTSAEVSKASLKYEYIEEPYLSTIIELNRPEWHPEAPYEYDPELCIFQDRLFVVYRTYSWRDTNQSDADIALNSTYDGITWQTELIELTKAPDTEVPYTGGKRSGDFYPNLAVFKNHLYCAWESASQLPEGTTHDSDRDIVWTRYDGKSWSEPQELTAPDAQAAEDLYSMNPGVKDDYRVQLCTFNNGSAEQLFAVWTANNTGDEWFPEERKGDIIISKTIDGMHWTTGLDLTKDDRRYDEDYLPQLIEYETPMGNALFVFWVSNNVANTNGSDWDIVYQYTFDGVTWSKQLNLMDRVNVMEPVNKENSIDEDPFLIIYNKRLCVLWRSSNPNLGNGDDIDIVMTSTEDGFNWTKPIELTPKEDGSFNNRPRAVVYNNNLAVLWRTVEDYDEGEIVLQLYNGTLKKISELIKVSPQNDGGNDYSPDLIEFNNRLMVAWVTQDNLTTRGRDSDLVFRSVIPNLDIPEIAINLGDNKEYNGDWLLKKFKPITDDKNEVVFTELLQSLLNNNEWTKTNKVKDEFRNELYYIPINTYFSDPGKIRLNSLEIKYNYSFLIPDLSSQLSDLLKSHDQINDDNILIVLRFESSSNGKLLMADILVEYSVSTEPNEYPEIYCIAIFGIILIILGLIIKFSKIKPKEPDKEKR